MLINNLPLHNGTLDMRVHRRPGARQRGVDLLLRRVYCQLYLVYQLYLWPGEKLTKGSL
jgi:hypothetical protein